MQKPATLSEIMGNQSQTDGTATGKEYMRPNVKGPLTWNEIVGSKSKCIQSLYIDTLRPVKARNRNET